MKRKIKRIAIINSFSFLFLLQMLLWPFYSTIVSEFDAPWQPLELFLDFIQILFLVQLWQIHNAEQMIMDDMEVNPDKYKDKKLTELTDDEDFDEQNSVEYTKAYHKKALLPKMILVSIFLVAYDIKSICSCILLT